MGPGTKLLLIAAAGALGAMARYVLAAGVQRVAGPVFPFGTLAVNMLGCFLFGLVFAVAEHRAGWSADARLILLVGFLGAFTTFSTFAHESAVLLQSAQWLHLGVNLALQNLVGIAMIYAGWSLAQR